MIDFIKKENTHLVLKEEDINKYLTELERNILSSIYEKIIKSRIKDGKRENSYYIVNVDEPYSEKILLTIADGETMKENTNPPTLFDIYNGEK